MKKKSNFSFVNLVQNVLKPKYNDLETNDEKSILELNCKKDKINPSNPNSALILSYKNEKQIDEIIIEMKNLFEKFTENELLSFKEQA